MMVSDNEEAKAEITAIFHGNKGRYGYGCIAEELRNRKMYLNHKRLMKQLGLILSGHQPAFPSFGSQPKSPLFLCSWYTPIGAVAVYLMRRNVPCLTCFFPWNVVHVWLCVLHYISFHRRIQEHASTLSFVYWVQRRVLVNKRFITLFLLSKDSFYGLSLCDKIKDYGVSHQLLSSFCITCLKFSIW